MGANVQSGKQIGQHPQDVHDALFVGGIRLQRRHSFLLFLVYLRLVQKNQDTFLCMFCCDAECLFGTQYPIWFSFIYLLVCQCIQLLDVRCDEGVQAA